MRQSAGIGSRVLISQVQHFGRPWLACLGFAPFTVHIESLRIDLAGSYQLLIRTDYTVSLTKPLSAPPQFDQVNESARSHHRSLLGAYSQFKMCSTQYGARGRRVGWRLIKFVPHKLRESARFYASSEEERRFVVRGWSASGVFTKRDLLLLLASFFRREFHSCTHFLPPAVAQKVCGCKARHHQVAWPKSPR